ncbi:MAG: hypothetical protein KOO63_07825 [Bacteroidales bacterium]|nr:hypothetical protein [Candidatus Latescibacterota bacterium]
MTLHVSKASHTEYVIFVSPSGAPNFREYYAGLRKDKFDLSVPDWRDELAQAHFFKDKGSAVIAREDLPPDTRYRYRIGEVVFLLPIWQCESVEPTKGLKVHDL